MARNPDRPRRPLSGEETQAFAAAMAGVKPLKPGAATRPAPSPPPPVRPQVPAPEPAPILADPGTAAARPDPAPNPNPNPLPSPNPGSRAAIPGLDRRKTERLRKGALPIEGRLDLHGMTQQDAHAALERFLSRSVQAERRCLLVITGKGRTQAGRADGAEWRGGGRDGEGRGGGVLRQALPRWLAQTPHRTAIVAVQPAAPQHGGAGAFYVLLRRRRAP